jgi:hypothetical protein
MESIKEQWNPPSPPDILSNSWTNISDAKKAVKIWILDCGDQDTGDQDTGDRDTSNQDTSYQDTRPQKRRYSSEALDSTGPSTECRYPLRKRQLTVKAAALIIEE